MDTIGLDLHKRESQLCIGHDDGSVEKLRWSQGLIDRSRPSAAINRTALVDWLAMIRTSGRSLCMINNVPSAELTSLTPGPAPGLPIRMKTRSGRCVPPSFVGVSTAISNGAACRVDDLERSASQQRDDLSVGSAEGRTCLNLSKPVRGFGCYAQASAKLRRDG